MKRFLIFSDEAPGGHGGFADFCGSADTIDEALAILYSFDDGLVDGDCWAHVFDADSRKIVFTTDRLYEVPDDDIDFDEMRKHD